MSNVRDFGARGDGRTDDTEAVLHAARDGDGQLTFPPGDYLLTRTIRLELDQRGRFSLQGSSGTAKIIMAGEGPAFHLIGTHTGTADPTGFQPIVWGRERMPTVLNLEIEGRHPKASGFLIEGIMQPTFEGVLLRELEHAIHLRRRARNLLVSHCHIFNNRGTGVFLDGLNLHQAIITGSHISYCLRGGIRIVDSEIRNLQITGNDIEYNYDLKSEESADVWIDSRGDKSSVREGTIVGNTIQAKYSPGGANIRMLGHNPEKNHKAGLFTISGNMIGSQEVNIHLSACRGVVVDGNVVYSGHHRNLLVEGSRNIVIGSNSFDHNPDYEPKQLCTGIQIQDSTDCNMTGSIIHDCQTGQHTVPEVRPIKRLGLVEIIRCRGMQLTGCQILDGMPSGLYIEDSSQVSVTGCRIVETREENLWQSPIRWLGEGSGNLLAVNTLGKGKEEFVVDPQAGVRLEGNLMLD